MADVKFTYEGLDIIIRCNKNQKMRDICTYLSTKINVNINSLIFLYGGTQLNLEKTFKELTKENKINSSLKGIKKQIKTMINDINNKVDINDINTQLENIIILINKIDEDNKINNNKLNINKINNNNIIKSNNNNKKEEIIKNEITSIYNKQEDEINLLHDYCKDKNGWNEEVKKSYIEGKNNINENNIDII